MNALPKHQLVGFLSLIDHKSLLIHISIVKVFPYGENYNQTLQLVGRHEECPMIGEASGDREVPGACIRIT